MDSKNVVKLMKCPVCGRPFRPIRNKRRYRFCSPKCWATFIASKRTFRKPSGKPFSRKISGWLMSLEEKGLNVIEDKSVVETFRTSVSATFKPPRRRSRTS